MVNMKRVRVDVTRDGRALSAQYDTMNARCPTATTMATVSTENVNAAGVTLAPHVNKWTARTPAALDMAFVCLEHVSAGKAGEGPIATKWMMMKNSASRTARATGASKPNWGSASATEASLEMIVLLKCAILIVENEATVKEVSVFVTKAGEARIVLCSVVTHAALLTESALMGRACAPTDGMGSIARLRDALQTAMAMVLVRCPPTGWPGNASVRRGGTDLAATFSLNSSAMTKLTMIETAWWTVRTPNVVKTRSVNEVNSATPCLRL